MPNDDRLILVVFLRLARHAVRPQERDLFFGLAEACSRLAQQEVIDPGAARSRKAA
jgi:hypothetical protein